MEKKYTLTGNLTGDILSPRGFPQATEVLCRWQKYFLILLVIFLALWAIFDWRQELLVVNFVLTVFYLVSTLHRLYTIHLALKRSTELQFTAEEMKYPPNGKEWPKYLVILPMYREGEVLPELISSLEKLEYPKDRLEIRLLIEEDDDETRSVAESMDLQHPFKIILIPASEPRTKPKACNIGIEDAEADFLVIYDAEDKPDPDQLRKAVWSFHTSPDNVACIQGKLAYYNHDWNLLTRCFTVEYTTWYNLILPGLDQLHAPLPLGGTSNHFKMGVLREMGAWDEYNVTEDCDLGIRLFDAGWHTRVMESTTWEQACPKIPLWIAQRSRWAKGYMQTYFVHTRDIIGLHKRLGFWNSIHFHLFIGGNTFSQLINPFYWVMTLMWLVFRPTGMQEFFPLPIFVMGSICLFAGNFIFAYSSVIACVRRGTGFLASTSLIMPLYWILMSIGAWKGTLQLFHKPHHWEKTQHFATEQET